MHTWWPDEAQSIEARVALALFTRQSLHEIFQAHLPTRVGILAEILDSGEHTPLGLLQPELFQWYFALVGSLAAGSAEKPSAVADRLPAVMTAIERSRARAAANASVIGAPIDTTSLTPAAEIIARAQQEGLDAFGVRPEIMVLSTLSDEHNRALRNAFALLAETWPQAYREIQDLVQRIHIFESPHVLGFTDFEHHGMIALWAGELRPEDPAHVAAEILHEASHVLLNTVIAVTPLFLNDQAARYPTPLRPDPRPMFGVFHQMFVLGRALYLYTRLWERTGRYTERRAKTLRQLAGAVATVSEHAELTDSGRALMAAMHDLLDQEQRRPVAAA